MRVRLLSYNLFCRPPGVHSGEVFGGVFGCKRYRRRSDLKNRRLAEFINRVLPQYDIVVLQEIFSLVTNRQEILIRSAIKAGFFYYVRSKAPPIFSRKMIDGGVLILSRYPITEQDYFTFSEGINADGWCSKGVAYAKIMLCPPIESGDTPGGESKRDLNGVSFHLFATHLQAGGPWKIRQSQLDELSSFMARKTKSGGPLLPIVLTGDFNVDARSNFMVSPSMLPPLTPSSPPIHEDDDPLDRSWKKKRNITSSQSSHHHIHTPRKNFSNSTPNSSSTCSATTRGGSSEDEEEPGRPIISSSEFSEENNDKNRNDDDTTTSTPHGAEVHVVRDSDGEYRVEIREENTEQQIFHSPSKSSEEYLIMLKSLYPRILSSSIENGSQGYYLPPIDLLRKDFGFHPVTNGHGHGRLFITDLEYKTTYPGLQKCIDYIFYFPPSTSSPTSSPISTSSNSSHHSSPHHSPSISSLSSPRSIEFRPIPLSSRVQPFILKQLQQQGLDGGIMNNLHLSSSLSNYRYGDLLLEDNEMTQLSDHYGVETTFEFNQTYLPPCPLTPSLQDVGIQSSVESDTLLQREDREYIRELVRLYPPSLYNQKRSYLYQVKIPLLIAFIAFMLLYSLFL